MAREVVRCPRCAHVNPASRNTCEREGCPTSLMGVPSYPEEAPGQPEGVPAVVPASGAGDTVDIEGQDQVVLIHVSTGARLRVTGYALLGRAGTIGLELFAPLRTISRRHASLQPIGSGSWTVTDEGSRHGTYVNGERLTPGVAKALRAGDIVKLADHSFVVSLV